MPTFTISTVAILTFLEAVIWCTGTERERHHRQHEGFTSERNRLLGHSGTVDRTLGDKTTHLTERSRLTKLLNGYLISQF